MEISEQLAQKASTLKPIEKLKLVDAILYSIEEFDPEIEKKWVAESEQRYRAYKKGDLKTKDWVEIKKRYNS